MMQTLIPLLLALPLLAVESTWAFSSIGSSIGISPSNRGVTNAVSGALYATKLIGDGTPRVEKVAIVGAGIAGLSLAHALRSTNMGSSQPIQIDIFDSRATLDEKSGSGIQLTGGMAALNQISPSLQQSVSEASLPFERVVSTCRPWFGDDGMKSWKIFELDLQQAIREKDTADKAKAEEEEGNESVQNNNIGLVTEEGEVLAYTILRGTLQRILQEQLMQEHGVKVQFDKRLCGIEQGGYCQFTDGTKTGPYDLVVGCDGIQSAVRQYVQRGAIDPSKKESAIYSGLRITFAIQEEDTEDDIANSRKCCQFTQYFGNGAYALTSSYGAGKGKPRAKGAFLVYPDANYIGPFPRQQKSNDDNTVTKATAADTSSAEAKPLAENADWTQNNRIPKEKIMECLDILQSASIPGNDVSSIIEKSDRFFDLGVYLHNPFSSWVREIPNSNDDAKIFAVTTGDASHAMPPFLGQGANQALQDSCSLARRIHEYNNQSSSDDVIDLKSVLKEYEKRRWLPTTSITAKAAILGYLEVGPGLFANFRDIFFFVMGKLNVAKKVFLDAATPKL